MSPCPAKFPVWGKLRIGPVCVRASARESAREEKDCLPSHVAFRRSWQIVKENYRTGGSGILVVEPDRGARERLTSSYDFSPAFSPNGNKIVFSKMIFDGGTCGRIWSS